MMMDRMLINLLNFTFGQPVSLYLQKPVSKYKLIRYSLWTELESVFETAPGVFLKNQQPASCLLRDVKIMRSVKLFCVDGYMLIKD